MSFSLSFSCRSTVHRHCTAPFSRSTRTVHFLAFRCSCTNCQTRFIWYVMSGEPHETVTVRNLATLFWKPERKIPIERWHAYMRWDEMMCQWHRGIDGGVLMIVLLTCWSSIGFCRKTSDCNHHCLCLINRYAELRFTQKCDFVSLTEQHPSAGCGTL
jgi:hypothetical protein